MKPGNDCRRKATPSKNIFNSRWGMDMIRLQILEKLDLQAADNPGRRHLCTWIPRKNEDFERMVAWGGHNAGAMGKKEQEIEWP